MRYRTLAGLLFAPGMLLGQTQIKYELTNITPGLTASVGSADGPTTTLVNQNKFVLTITATSRDSAGGTMWEVQADSGIRSIVILNDALSATYRSGMTRPNMPPSSPTTWRVFVRDGKIEFVERNGTASKAVISPVSPLNSVLAQFPGLSITNPKGGFPAKGESRTDSSATTTDQAPSNIGFARGGPGMSFPAGKKYDTTLVSFNHAKGDSVIVTSYASSTAPSGHTVTTGTQLITFDAKQLLLSVESTTTRKSAVFQDPNMAVPPITTVTTMTLKRVP